MRPWKESILLTTVLLVMQLTQTMPVYAGQIDNRSLKNKNVDTEEITFKPEDSGASRDSVLTGSIKVELISVELPAGGIEFQVNTDIPFHADNPGAQIQGPDIHVANHSVVPVKLEISQVADVGEGDVVFSPQFSEQVEQTFRLVDKVSGTGPPGSAILVLGVAGTRYGSEQEFEKYAIVPGRQNIFITDIPAEESRELNLYGKVTPDFYGEYQFTVRPTLKISAVQAEPAD
ncbi:MAG: hypothetical protein ACLTC4_18915 [Hungatella hathewayi]|uniref:Uncharacterized protein n=1 Tax=Hungatella hathewayi WAL-18680 TaxID=742737 RepID=G5IDN6_9FIRM|nr:hypothetical protein [Hungatella hathewayi]EHI60404.1 hypothetical protein HMPREF9473_01613 [ [Hungatella hathewayi WAL-18680]